MCNAPKLLLDQASRRVRKPNRRTNSSEINFHHFAMWLTWSGANVPGVKNAVPHSGFAGGARTIAGARYEFECCDTSHLYNLGYFLDERLVKPPLFIQTVFGLLGGIGPHPEDVQHMKRTADRLFVTDYPWSMLGAGRSQMPIAAMGGNVRVGLEIATPDEARDLLPLQGADKVAF
jgi:hypothetical protein